MCQQIISDTDKTKYVLFHKAKSKHNLPLVLPDLFINDAKIKRENSLKYLGVMIDENLTWNTDVELVEKKISKSVKVLFKDSRFLNSKSLRSIYFALVHLYLNYANITWASTNKTCLKIILGKQKQAAKLISSDDISISSKLLMKQLNILNVSQISIIHYLLFMFQVKSSIIPKAFNQVFSLIDYIYPTRLSDNSFKVCGFYLKLTRVAIGFRGPTVWNKKSYTSIAAFKNKINEKS